jgi:hypothetical protein
MNRRTHWREHGNSVSPDARIWTAYDANGNVRRTTAEYRHLDQNGAASPYVTGQEFWYRYDSMNRVVTAKGQMVGGQIVRGHQGTDFAYNQAGQRVASTKTAYRTAYIHNPNYYEDPYYRDPYGPRYYDDPYYPGYGGEPTIAVSYDAEVREQYEYDAGGALHGVRIAESGYSDNYDGTLTVTAPPPTGELKARYWQNLLGLNYRQIDYRYNGDHNGEAAYDREVFYNGKDQAYGENTFSRQGADWITNIIRHDFAANGEYALGAITYTHSHNYKNNNDGALANTETRTWYGWYDGAVQSRIEFRPDTGSNTRFNTHFYYDGSGHLVSAQINDGRPRSVSYKNDLTGQTLRRDESDRNYSSGDPHEVWYRFGGKQMGYVGNNGTLDTDYQTSIQNRMRTGSSTTGAFRFGATYGSSYADFDLSVDPFTSYEQGGAGGSHTVRAGESLQSIAQNLWGDANLWYKLAEANGMVGALSEGQRLTIPAGVMKNTHNAGTLKPYDPSEIIGDVNPTTPKPQQAKKGNKCGVFGTVLLVVVAVAVTALTQGATTAFFTSAFAGSAAAGSAAATAAAVAGGIVGGAVAGAAGSIASQAVGLATGIQDKFSWKGVALAAIGGGVGGGIAGLGNAANAAAAAGKTLNAFGRFAQGVNGGGMLISAGRALAANVASQSIGLLTGLQRKFDWAGAAAAAIGAGAGVLVGGALGAQSFKVDRSFGNIAANTVTGAARAIANAATRSLADGSDFGDNMLAALPDVIGQTIGDLVADSITNPETMKAYEARLARETELARRAAAAAPQFEVPANFTRFTDELPNFALTPAVLSYEDQYNGAFPLISLLAGQEGSRGYLDFPTRYLLGRGEAIDREMALHYAKALGIDPDAPIFIGGGGEDYLIDPGVVESYVSRRGDGNYFRHYERQRVDSAIEIAFGLGKPVILVGHSWGADRALETAFRALRRGIPVDLLVTIDPVTGRNDNHRPTDYQRLARDLGGLWVNVRATEYLHSREPGIFSSDNIAGVGGRMRFEDQQRAHVNVESRVRHWDFPSMMVGGRVETMIRSIYQNHRARGR